MPAKLEPPLLSLGTGPPLELRALRVLLANGSQISSLPAALATLDQLERANFSDNVIEKLPLALQEKWSDALVAGGRGGVDADAAMEGGEGEGAGAGAAVMLRGNPSKSVSPANLC